MEKITFVLTSCGRLDLLEITLDSFFKYNTYPIERFIITEDSADQNIFDQCIELNKKYDNKLEFITNYSKIGQSRSIDLAYSKVNTPYVFHLEDDYEFYASGFIEKSLDILKTRPDILQSWLQPKSDGQVNSITPTVFYTPNGTPYRSILPASFYTGRVLENGQKEAVYNYIGFTYRPTLKRMSDYHLLGSGGYTQFGQEHLVDYKYRDLGFRIVSLTVNDSDGYVKHIGWKRRVENTVH